MLHSTWGRHNTTKQIIALFKLYDLDNFIIDIINEDNEKKDVFIIIYLNILLITLSSSMMIMTYYENLVHIVV